MLRPHACVFIHRSPCTCAPGLVNQAVAFHMCYGPNTQIYTSDCCQVPASGQQDQPDSTGVICMGVKPRRLEQSTQAPLQSFLQKKLRAAGSLTLKAKSEQT